MLKIPIYLDHNATTPCDPRVVEVMLPYLTEHFGNAASRNHVFGWAAEAAVDSARKQVANLIGSDPEELVFTSGATEADNLAIKGVFEMYARKGNHIITSNIEHKAVLDTLKHLGKMGAEVTYLPVNNDGLISAEQVEAAIKPNSILISIMYANNETGTIMPVAEIGHVARKHDVLFFTDATQAVGKIPVDVNRDRIDILAMSAHKMFGPKGIGALYVRRKNPRVKLSSQIHGGGHERGMRSGTLNVPGIAGFGKACELAMHEMKQEAERLCMLRDKLENALLKLEESYVNGSRLNRLPHVSNISFKYVETEALMMGFNRELAISSGSACTSGSLEPSYVLKALGLDDEQAHGSLRFGLGRFNTEEEIDHAISMVTRTVNHQREISPAWQMFKNILT
jgi:cysteine desulfurase